MTLPLLSKHIKSMPKRSYDTSSAMPGNQRIPPVKVQKVSSWPSYELCLTRGSAANCLPRRLNGPMKKTRSVRTSLRPDASLPQQTTPAQPCLARVYSGPNLRQLEARGELQGGAPIWGAKQEAASASDDIQNIRYQPKNRQESPA